jgi:hypothetical protein
MSAVTAAFAESGHGDRLPHDGARDVIVALTHCKAQWPLPDQVGDAESRAIPSYRARTSSGSWSFSGTMPRARKSASITCSPLPACQPLA